MKLLKKTLQTIQSNKIFVQALIFVLAISMLSFSNIMPVKAIVQKPTTILSKKTLYVGGQNYKIRMRYLSSNATVTYKSSKKAIATVTNKGSIKAVAKGTATITVTVTQNKIKYASKITVTVLNDKTYPAFDMGGRVIKVGTWFDQYYTSKHTKISDDPNVYNSKTAQMKLDNIRRIEEKYNCKIQYVTFNYDSIQDSINTTIGAGKPECDIYLSDLQFGIAAVVNGLAQDISKVASSTSDLYNKQLNIKPFDTPNGTYLFTEQGLSLSSNFLGYNATMIEELGLEDPQELYANGEWTWEKFAEYALDGTVDYDGDGTVDVYGYGGIYSDFIRSMVLNNGGSLAATKTEGLSSKPVVEVLDFINRLYNIDQSAQPWQGNWNDNLFSWTEGKVMFWTAQLWSQRQATLDAASKGEKIQFDYHIVPYPIGPSGDGTIYFQQAGNFYFLPVGVTKPTQVLQVFEEFLNWHEGNVEYRGDPSWIESCLLTKEDVNIYYECSQNMKLDYFSYLQGKFDLYGSIFEPIVIYNKSVTNVVEDNKQVLQEDLDKFFSR